MQWWDTIAGAVLAAEPAGLWAQLGPPAVGALAMILVGVITQMGTLRASSRTAQAQRDSQLDDRADRQYALLQQECAEARNRAARAEQERDDYRERWAKLRLSIIAAGFDPDDVKPGRAGGGPVTGA